MTLYQPLKLANLTLKVFPRPRYMITALLLIDGLCLSLAGYISVSLRLWFNGQFQPEFYWRLWPLVFLFLAAYALSGLYAGKAMGPVEELRQLTLTTSEFYLLLGAVIFLFRESILYSRATFLMSWGLSLIFVLLGRYLLRAICAKAPWWGYPVLILGAGKTGEMVIRTLQRHPELGLKPIAILDDDPRKRGMLLDVPVMGKLSVAPSLAHSFKIPYAVVAMPGIPRHRLLNVLEQYGRKFPHLLIIPDLFGMASLWVVARDMGGVLGLESRQQLLLPGPRLVKAWLDKGLAILVGLFSIPLLILISVLIRLDSSGPVFYSQTRIGQNGRPFKAWKFRSMVVNADQVLSKHLNEHPELASYWEKDHKLKRDPRITRLGHFLRRTSLDELPQLWNVLRGEMSLVGPRPIVEAEVWRYADKFDLYLQVLPGVTGLWQVSGRNNTSYEERVNLDAYYVRNWSVWLDIYILIRTCWVVISGDGAY